MAYKFSEVLVSDAAGGALRVARNARIQVLDPSTGTVAPGLSVNGQLVSSITSDNLGRGDWSANIPVVKIVAPNGLSKIIESPDVWENFAIGAVPFADPGETSSTKAIRSDDVRVNAPVLPGSVSPDDITELSTYSVIASNNNPGRPTNQTATLRTIPTTSNSRNQYWSEVGGQRQILWRYSGSLGWLPWQRLDPGDRTKFGTLAPGSAVSTSIEPGMWLIPDTTGVTGLPTDAPGVVEASGGTIRYTELGQAARLWERRFIGGLWSAWGRVRGERAMPHALTRPQAATTETTTSRSVRIPFSVPGQVRRWRVVIRNANYRTNTAYSGGATLSSVNVGTGARSANGTLSPSFVASQDFPSGLRALVANVSVADLGDGWSSGWQGTPLTAGVDYLLSYGYTMAAGPTVHLGMGGGWWTNGNPGNAGLLADNTVVSIIRAPFDVRLELIMDDATQVDVIIGDSINAGSNTTLPVKEAPARQGLSGSGRVPVLHAFGGAALGEWIGVNWGDATSMKWRDVTAYGRADRALIALGSNDINNGTDLTTLQANFLALAALVRERVSANIVACTVTPRTTWTGTANETLRQAFNAWLRSLPGGIAGCLETAAAVEDSNGTAPRAELVVGDGIHFNTAGSGMLGQAIAYGGASAGAARAKGDPGPPGADGASDSVVAGYFGTSSLTRAASDGRGDQRWVKSVDLAVSVQTSRAGIGIAPSTSHQAFVVVPSGTDRTGLRVEQNNVGGGADAVKIVNRSSGYGLKIDHLVDNQDAVNITATGAGAYTTLGMGGSNTSLSTVKVTNDAAQTGGAVVFAQGTHAGRTAAIFGGDSYGGSGAVFSARGAQGGNVTAFRAMYDAGYSYTSRIFWVDANHADGSLFYLNNATPQTAGQMLRIVAAAGATAPILKIENPGTGDHIQADNFGVSQSGNVRAPAIFNNTSFNNARLQLAAAGSTIDRNVADANATLRINSIHASATGDVLQVLAQSAIRARFNKNGQLAIRVNAAPADADVATGEAVLWFDSTTGAAKIMWKAKDAGGTVRTGSLALA